MAGFKDFTAGEVLTADDVDGYLMRQTIMGFASTTARDTALSGVLAEGMFAFTTDTDSTWYYDGSAWVAWHTPWTTFTPTWANFTIGNGTQTYRYRYVGGDMEIRGHSTLGSTSSVSGSVSLTLPNSETSNSAGYSMLRVVRYDDSEVTGGWGMMLVTSSSTTGTLYGGSYETFDGWSWATSDYWIIDGTVAL